MLVASLWAPTHVQAVAYTSAGSGDWGNPLTWSPNGVPNAADTVVIAGGHTVTVTTAQAALGATINASGVLTVTSTTLTVGATGMLVNGSGTVNNNGTIALTGNLTGGGSLIQGTSSTLTLANASAPTLTTLNATANLPNTVNYNGAGQAISSTYSYSRLTLSGSGAKTGNTPATISTALTIAGTATYSLTAVTIAGDLNVQGGTLTIPNVIVTVSGNTTVSGGTLTFSTAGTAKTFTGDVVINGGTWTNNVANVPVTIAGNITYLSGTFTGGTGAYTLTGTNKLITGPITIPTVTVTTGTGLTLTGTNTFGAFTVTSPATVTNQGTLTISAALGVTAQIAGTGTFTNAANSQLDLETNTTAGNFAITTLNANAVPNTVRYTLAGAQTVKATGVAAYHHLVLNGSGAKTPAAAINVNGDLTLQDPATLVTGAFVHNLYGNFINNSNQATPVIATGGTLNFETPATPAATSIGGSSASTITLVTANFNNVQGVSTSKTVIATTVAVGGGASFTNTGTQTWTTTTVNGAATLTNGAGGTFTGTTFTVNSSGTVTNAATATAMTLSGTVTVNSSATLTNNGTLTISGTLVGTGSFIAGTSSTTNLNNATAPTITTFNLTSNTPNLVVYGLNGAQGVRSATYSNLTLSAAGAAAIKTAGGSILVNGTFTLTSTAALTTGAFDHTFAGSWVHDSTAATPLVGTAGFAVIFSTPTPAAATSITGAGTGALGFTNLTVTNTAEMSLSKPITSTGTLTVNSSLTVNAAGTIGLSGAGALTLAANATVTNASTLTNSGTGAITLGDGATFTNNNIVNSTSTGAIVVGSSLATATFTNNATVTASGNLDGPGQFVNAATGTLNLAGSAAPTITTFGTTAVGNTVNYSLGGAQSVRGGTYHHLTLATSGTKTAGALGSKVLIGMDVMNLGDFAVTNHGGKTMFTFRTPSQKHIDFVADGKVPQFSHGPGQQKPQPRKPRPNPGGRGRKK